MGSKCPITPVGGLMKMIGSSGIFHVQLPGMISIIQANTDHLGWFNW